MARDGCISVEVFGFDEPGFVGFSGHCAARILLLLSANVLVHSLLAIVTAGSFFVIVCIFL